VTEPYYQDDAVTLYHGDCLELREWLGAGVLITDPPYGSEGLAVGYGRNSHFNIANDATSAARDTVLEQWGYRPVLCFGTPRMAEPPGDWTHRLVWDKREPGLNGGPWRYTHESIFVRGDGWHRVSASSFSIISIPSGNGTAEKADHTHSKPVRLMERLIEAAPPGVIADPFAGSGSTLIAAKNLGRRTIGVEIEERFCEIAAKRLAQGVLTFGGGAA
jgi:site-specific DNA-methyltransferase (adenine-specific)